MNVIKALWWRDMLRFKKEPSRWLGIVAQPLIFWVVIGSGMAKNFRLAGAENTSYLEYFFPGTLVMCVLFTTIFASMSVIEDRNAGFLQAVLAAPSTPLSLVVGKVAGVTTLALMQAFLFLAFAPFAHFSLGSIQWTWLLQTLVLGSVGLAGLNFAMAWAINSTHGYHAIMSVVLIPLWILSGAMFPMDSSWMAWVARVNPLSYFVAAVRSSLSAAEQSSLSVLSGTQYVGLWIFAFAAIAIAALVVKKVQGAKGEF